jgi:hypothetical protein
MADVDLPGLPPIPRGIAIAGGGLLLGILGYAWWRAGQQTGPPAAETFPGAVEQPSDLIPADVGGVSSGGGTTSTGLEFITTNDQWTQKAVAILVDLGYDAVLVSQALGKYLANQTVTQTEATWIQAAVALVGKPPIGEHSIRLAPVSPSPVTKAYKYVVETHQFSVRTNAREAVRRFSDDAVETNNRIQVALVATVADPRNARYLSYYRGHGAWPPQSKIYLHVVKQNPPAKVA